MTQICCESYHSDKSIKDENVMMVNGQWFVFMSEASDEFFPCNRKTADIISYHSQIGEGLTITFSYSRVYAVQSSHS